MYDLTRVFELLFARDYLRSFPTQYLPDTPHAVIPATDYLQQHSTIPTTQFDPTDHEKRTKTSSHAMSQKNNNRFSNERQNADTRNASSS